MTVATLEDLDHLVERVRAAQAKYEDYDQEQVDNIFRAAARAGFDARLELAFAAVEETGMGIVEDKVFKNVAAAEYVYNEYKDTKTRFWQGQKAKKKNAH